jgi:hypothetical protein
VPPPRCSDRVRTSLGIPDQVRTHPGHSRYVPAHGQ